MTRRKVEEKTIYTVALIKVLAKKFSNRKWEIVSKNQPYLEKYKAELKKWYCIEFVNSRRFTSDTLNLSKNNIKNKLNQA